METLYDTWQTTPSDETFKALWEKVTPVISKAITSYAPQAGEAVQSRAKLLAMKALKSFDPSRNVKLQSHLMTRLQPLIRLGRQRTSPIQVPERVSIDAYRVQEAEKDFEDTSGRVPTDIELADKVGVSRKRIAMIRSYMTGRIMPEAAMEESESLFAPAKGQSTPDSVWIEYIYYDLDPTDRLILEWRTGMHGKNVLSNQEIARRLKITPSAVSQRAAKVMLKIKEGEELTGAW